MKVSDNYDIREFVSPHTWNEWGTSCIWFVDPKLINGFELLKAVAEIKYGECSVVVNGWLYDMGYTGSGYRNPDQYNTGQFRNNPNSDSLHRQGKAGDAKIKIKSTGKWLSSDEMFALVQNHEAAFLEVGITCVENPEKTKGRTRDWLHIDCRNTNGAKDILIVNP
ncbi:MAG: hypothetical protein ACPG5O_15600 [Pseudoalteromonas tetraodonis]